MKAELSRLILFVDDIERMSYFYEGVLGLEKLPGGTDGFVCFSAGASQVCLHSLPAEYRSNGGEYPQREDTYVKFVFHSTDVAADRQHLLDNGVRMNEVVRYGEMEFCDGADPEGNIFQISSR
jgi:catechol 2,3-dioxygenase-like lactoylglutathione lyase family enzyme